MKGDAKLLSKAEQAIDDATEARDVANDLNGVMAEFASTGVADVDDDDLVAELEDMIANEPPPPPAAMSEAEKQSEIALLEEKLAERERSKETRAALSAMPAAPTNSMGKKAISKEEKAGLLAGISQSA